MVLNGELNLRRDRAVWEKSATSSQVSACTGAAPVSWRGRDERFRSHARQGRETGWPSCPHQVGRANPWLKEPAGGTRAKP